MSPVNLHEGETLVRIRFNNFGHDVQEFEYLNCYAFYSDDRLFVRSYDDPPGLLPRASFKSAYVLMVEHHGEHHPRKGSRKPAEAPAAPAADLPTDEQSEAAMQRFLAAAPKAESHLPERRFLESAEGEADPKDGFSTEGESGSGQKAEEIPSVELPTALELVDKYFETTPLRPKLPENIPGTPLPPTKYVPLEIQPEEVERRVSVLRPKVELAKEVTHGVAIPSTAGPEMNFSGSAANRETRRAQSKGTTSKAAKARGSHAKPKPPGTAVLSALVLPLAGFFLAAFRVRMG